ncbi:hypothetical protein H8B09_19725 [Paenibacillus sp. PR3]|uniref:AAA+ ATPase domain-containing protein n=1 Tax=Paenibacillus terricola TaxID=2763503 RepID=A0ABR8MYI1_9BACL|nr:hypothetical protein [Paenibacillus terricola]MBD3921005.1 hypothetical protein [Paenibacillus terricola]
MIPCLNKEALRLFVGTADERYEYSSEYFRATHFPQIMHRYQGDQLTAEITEKELYQELLEVDSIGNRLFFIFGSTGSGKSELLCWLKDKWLLNEIDRPVIRISRTELNPQVLIKKCYEALNIPLSIPIDEHRWDLLMKKPITLINQMVWTTLAETLPSDEEIVPVALMIRPIIEKNVTEFTMQVQRGHITRPLEVLHHRQFKELLSNTTISISLEYLPFRQMLSRKLDQFLFEGWDINSLFKQLTEQLRARNIRPLLLIDDLVQSVNIYASELLDQLITLEEGGWDVVIGLTPGALQDSERGFDLTQRVQNLDTINDRVKKLWLSDESGKEFYNLDRGQVVPYMTNYLLQLKGSQGFTCSSACRHYQECATLAKSSNDDNEEQLHLNVNLLPFNSSMIRRMYDAIPLGKGKLRYMILNSKELIRFFQKGNPERVTRVISLVHREKFADTSDLFIKAYAEWFAQEGQNTFAISGKVLNHFGYDLGDQIIPLVQLDDHQLEDNRTFEVSEVVKPSYDKSLIRDWVEGKQVNIELLESVRLGVSGLVHDVVKSINISRPHTPKSTAIIQRKEVINRSRYPISLEKSEKHEAIKINRSYAALQIAEFHNLKYSEKGIVFQKISNELETAMWIYQSEDLRLSWKDKLENELGMTMCEFALHLRDWANVCYSFSKISWISHVHSPFSKETMTQIEQVYHDWFMLRDNMFLPVDLVEIRQLNFGEWLIDFMPGKALESYQIGDTSLYIFLTRLKTEFQKYLKLLDTTCKELMFKRLAMVPYLKSCSEQKYHELADMVMYFNKKEIYSLKDYQEYTVVEEAITSDEVMTMYEKFKNLENEVHELRLRFKELCFEVHAFVHDSGSVLRLNVTHDETSLAILEKEKDTLLVSIDGLSRLLNCLVLTPKNELLELLSTQYQTVEVLNVKTIWNRLIRLADCLFEREHVGNELHTCITQWQVINFYEIRNQLIKTINQEVKRIHIIGHLQNDLGCNSSTDLHEMLNIIGKSDSLRPAIKRQLISLLEKGHSTLPPVQWRKLLDELKEKFPLLFEIVEIRLVVNEI